MASADGDSAVDGDAALEGAEEAGGRPLGRRVVLGMLGLGAAGVLVGARVQHAVSDALQPLAERDPSGLTSYLPGSERFRLYSVTGGFPLPPDPYRLSVGGLVDRPQSFDLATLREGLPQRSLTKDFQCVTGWRVQDVLWRGVLLRDVLDRAGVQTAAKAVRFVSFDGVYTESLTLEQARRDDVLVAHEMLGKPVTHDHGGPVRLYVAPMYGYKSLKWLSSIELTDTVEPGYWEGLGYAVDAWVGKSNGRDDEPVR